jgi:hypothetical protein
MCVGRTPKAPQTDPAVEAQQTEQRQQEQAVKSERRQTALAETVSRRRGGRGRRSLITGSSGGMGFYNEYV